MGWLPTVWYWILVGVAVAFVAAAVVRPAGRQALAARWKRDRFLRFWIYALPILAVAVVAYRLLNR